MTRLTRFGALAALVASQFSISEPDPAFKSRPLKPCLYCGKSHKHNNAFCSAEHAKLYKTLVIAPEDDR